MTTFEIIVSGIGRFLIVAVCMGAAYLFEDKEWCKVVVILIYLEMLK